MQGQDPRSSREQIFQGNAMNFLGFLCFWFLALRFQNIFYSSPGLWYNGRGTTRNERKPKKTIQKHNEKCKGRIRRIFRYFSMKNNERGGPGALGSELISCFFLKKTWWRLQGEDPELSGVIFLWFSIRKHIGKSLVYLGSPRRKSEKSKKQWNHL